jgi:formamidopyrimidine-DNA glycosylase
LFTHIVKKTKGPIKPLLLDQKKMSGLGNIYANDGLWDAKIDPRRKANSLSDQDCKKLYASLEKVLKKGLETGGASELSYVNALGQEGEYQHHFLVYAQDGKLCKRDGTKIEKFMLGGRGTYYCPQCQK